MKKLMFLFALLAWIGLQAYAQNTITGTVTSAQDGMAIPGANVFAKGFSKVGTVTDINGKFTVQVPADAKILVFSFVGMRTTEVAIEGRTVIDVALETEDVTLSDVVVVGYGTQQKANLTGAVASVDVAVLEARPISDVGRGLQGATPGLTVVIPSGEIGSDPIMRVRGQFSSFQGGSAPLVLVDNVEIPSILLLNPDDIESISVLKDAASSSIYGAKAAFGVILITTKKGARQESVNVNYSSNLSFQNISKKMEMAGLDALEYSVLAFERVGGTVAGAFWQITREGFERAKEWHQTWGTVVGKYDPMLYGRDWYVDANSRKIGLRTYDAYDFMVKEWTPTQTHNLSLNGRSGKTNYNVSLGYLDQEGLIKPSKIDDFRRYNGSLRLGSEISDKLRVFGGALYSKRVKRYAYATNSTTADPWLYIYRWGPTYPFTTEDGDRMRDPAYEMEAANTAFMETNYTSMNGGITYTPVKNWKINLEYTHANQEYINKRPGTSFTARNTWTAAIPKLDANGNRIYVDASGMEVPANSPGSIPAFRLSMDNYTALGANPDHVYRYVGNTKWNTLNLTTDYDLTLSESHKFKFLLGASRIGQEEAYNWSQTTQLVDLQNPQFDLAYGTQTGSGGESWESQVGFFGRVNYNFKERYLLEGNLRYDGSSKFPTDLKWRYFPSFSAGWRVTEESWMEWSQAYLNSLKLRGSWGMIGDQSVRSSMYIPTMSGGMNNWIIGGARLYQFGTPPSVSEDITWQDIVTLNLGFDMQVLKNRMTITFDWFQRNTNNMIVPIEGIGGAYGTGAPQSNGGALETKGYEIQVEYNHRFKNGLGLNITATFDDAITVVTKYGSTKSIDGWYAGKTYGEIWGYTTDRLYQKDDFAYDANGNHILVPAGDLPAVLINQLSDPNGATQARFQAGNYRFGPGDPKFVDLDGDGYITPGNRLIDDYGDLSVIGNSTPRYNYGLRIGADFKGFDASVFLQGVGSRQIWGDGFLAIAGFQSSDGAMPQAIAGNFWRPDRTDAFYPRPYNLAGSSATLGMQVQTRYLLDMSYLRIKNITVGYTLPAELTKRVKISKVRFYAALENFFTFDKLGGLPIDPEEISGYSMWNTTNYNLGRTGVGVPTFKSASLGLQLNF
jgi:TonB-linked SusC/RagA family outer membrane protein